MKIDDELYKELTDIWWDVLSENKDVTRFEDEFKTIAMDEGYTREDMYIMFNKNNKFYLVNREREEVYFIK